MLPALQAQVHSDCYVHARVLTMKQQQSSLPCKHTRLLMLHRVHDVHFTGRHRTAPAPNTPLVLCSDSGDGHPCHFAACGVAYAIQAPPACCCPSESEYTSQHQQLCRAGDRLPTSTRHSSRARSLVVCPACLACSLSRAWAFVQLCNGTFTDVDVMLEL